MWTRSKDGVLAGVCGGIAKRFDMDIILVRIGWLVAILFFGLGLGSYFILAVSLPREDRIESASENRILGVCSRFAKRFDLDLGLTRAGFLTLFFISGGTILMVYVLLYFILPKYSRLSQ